MAGVLKDKVALVTGSSSGIGLAIAIKFASKGAKVAITGRDEAKLKAALDKVVKASGGHADRFITIAGNLTNQEHRKEIVEKTVAKFGRLDILVANAGVSGSGQTVHTVTEEVYDEVMNTNVKSVIFLIKEAVSHLEKTKGNIISTSSTVAIMTMPNMLVYSASKAALEHATNILAVDLGSKGIRVNSVLPGYIPTTDLGRTYGSSNVDKFRAAIAKVNAAKQPLKERVLNEEDIAEAVAFLASDAAGCITGEHIKVDGARTFGGTIRPEEFASFL
jgi:NAD(P)-dependent dehydrogenase (short-subunit alcohol dehydrogenase family)